MGERALGCNFARPAMPATLITSAALVAYVARKRVLRSRLDTAWLESSFHDDVSSVT